MRRKIRKKAQAESQFNWIFMLIVGALILAFFGGLVLKMKASSEAKLSGTITKQLNSIFTGAGVSPGTAQIINIPRTRVRFTCTDYYIGVASQRMGNTIVFAPSELFGGQLITWTLQWDIPFSVKNFLYITNPFVKYVIVQDGDGSAKSEKAERLYNDLPKVINKEMITDLSSYTNDTNDDKIRIISFQADDLSAVNVGSGSWLTQEDVSAVWIDAAPPSSTGSAMFYYLDSGGSFEELDPDPAYYITDAMLYGLFFQEDINDYRCNIDKGINKAEIVTSIYYNKYVDLAAEFSNTRCAGTYSGAQTDMLAINNTVSVDGFVGLELSIGQLDERNRLAQLSSCPLLY